MPHGDVWVDIIWMSTCRLAIAFDGYNIMSSSLFLSTFSGISLEHTRTKVQSVSAEETYDLRHISPWSTAETEVVKAGGRFSSRLLNGAHTSYSNNLHLQLGEHALSDSSD